MAQTKEEILEKRKKYNLENKEKIKKLKEKYKESGYSKSYQKAWALKNPKKKKKYNSDYSKNHAEEIKIKKHQKYLKNKEIVLKKNKKYKKIYQQRNKVKVNARNLARVHIKIENRNCKYCNNPANQRHHPDYLQPLIVEFICSDCHERIHSKYLMKGGSTVSCSN